MRLFLQIILIVAAVSTVLICSLKPEMHKSVIVYNSDYVIAPENTVETETEDIPIMEIPAVPKTVTVKTEKKVEPIQKKNERKIVSTVKKQTPVKKTETKTVVTNTQKQTPVKSTETKIQQIPQKIVEPVKTVTTPVKTVVKTEPAKKILTQQEEEIAWNIWRSNLQNKIMKEVFLPSIPEGTVFRFSFNVDKFGRVSNVQTYATPSSYTPYAVQYIAPVIRSYQGKDILNFPTGSSRTSTEVKGGWKISASERYSTPQDYNDIEKISK